MLESQPLLNNRSRRYITIIGIITIFVILLEFILFLMVIVCFIQYEIWQAIWDYLYWK